MIHIHARISNIGRANRTYQVVTKVKSWGIPVIIFIHTGPLEIVLNIIAGNVTLHCRVVLYGNFSTVEHMRKVTVPVNWKNMVEEHSDVDTQKQFTLETWFHINEYRSIILPREY